MRTIPGRTIRHPVARGIAIQIFSWLLAVPAYSAALPSAPASGVVALQATLAVIFAAAVRSPTWWLGMHAAFSPALLVASDLPLPSELFLLGFIALALVYWSTAKYQVPLYLSGTHACATFEHLLAQHRAENVLDIGSGTGSFLVPLATRHRHIHFTGIEAAPLPWLVSRLRSRSLNNLRLVRGNLFRHHWGEYDLVYAFLSPSPMDAVWRKACKEMRAGTLLVSNSFAIPGATPVLTLEATSGPSLRRTQRFFVYRLGDGQEEN